MTCFVSIKASAFEDFRNETCNIKSALETLFLRLVFELIDMSVLSILAVIL